MTRSRAHPSQGNRPPIRLLAQRAASAWSSPFPFGLQLLDPDAELIEFLAQLPASALGAVRDREERTVAVGLFGSQLLYPDAELIEFLAQLPAGALGRG
jgi:hypothetical protein